MIDRARGVFRRTLPLCLLLFLVLVGQNAGLVHVIGHGCAQISRLAARQSLAERPSAAPVDASAQAVAQAAATASHPPGDDGAGCDKCYTFAQLASAATPHLPGAALVPAEHQCAASRPFDRRPAAVPPARSRGPPAVV